MIDNCNTDFYSYRKHVVLHISCLYCFNTTQPVVGILFIFCCRTRKRKVVADVEPESQVDDWRAVFPDAHYSSTDTVQQLQQQLADREREVQELQDKLAASEQRVGLPYMSYDDIKDDDCMLSHYTGLPDNATFQCVINFVARFTVKFISWTVISVSHENQLLITLMKLRHNFTHKQLAFLFKLSVAAISNITSAWIDILYELFFVGVLKAVGIPSRHKNQLSMPHSFDSFQGARITLDCTEIQSQCPV